MAEHHHHRPSRLSVPPRTAASTDTHSPSRLPRFPYTSLLSPTPTPTPSKQRISYLSTRYSTPSSRASSVSFLLLLLFSLRSFYSLLPFLRSSPSSFSVFPFSFLVSLLSFLLTLLFSYATSPSSSFSSSSKDPFRQKYFHPIFSISSITKSQLQSLAAKSLLLSVVFLLRFQALRYCGTAAMILAEVSGNVFARVIAEDQNRYSFEKKHFGSSSKVCGFISLFAGMLLLSVSWDRIECFPLSSVNINKLGFSVFPGNNCVRIWPIFLPFMSGFLGCYERISGRSTVKELGQKRVRLLSLFFTTALLFIPAVISMFVFEAEGDSISIVSLGWPLANTVVFGVLLSENYTDDKPAPSKSYQKEFLLTFVCTVALELFYFPELSLWGLLLSGLMLWFAVRGLDPFWYDYVELGVESSESLSDSIMKPIRHILSERKSRKIALFLLINTAYMVVEFVAGFMSNSLGLISDACHMLFDCAALAIGLYASYISRLPANGQFNYGRGRFEVLSGYVNAVFLVLVGALIVLESFERILDPQEISTNSLLVVSMGGLLVNVVGLVFFHEEHHHAHGGTGSCSHSHHQSRPSSSHNHLSQDKGHDHHFSTDHDHHHNSHHHVNDHDHHSSHLSEHDYLHNHSHEHSHLCQLEDHDHLGHSPNFEKHQNGSGSDQCRGHHHHRRNYSSQLLPDNNRDHDHHSDKHHLTLGSMSLSSHGTQYHLQQDGESKHQGHHHHIDHNMQGIFLHVLADTMGSVGVVVATLLIKYKGWLVADPACSILISVLIVYSVIPLLRNSAEILLQRVPRLLQQDLGEALNRVVKIEGVCGIRSLHFWSLTNTDVVSTLHVHVVKEVEKGSTQARVRHLLESAGVKDLTIQLEYVDQ